MKKVNIKTTTYDIGDGFRVDITQEQQMTEAWIYHEDYGIKEYIFGRENYSLTEMKKSLTGYLDLEFSKEKYREQHMDA